MSSEPPPLEFFFDRSLGKETAKRLREAGWVIHLIADHYPDDAQDVDDEVWIAEGSRRGWILLSKDKRIRYRGASLAELHAGRLFCLSNGNLVIDEMVTRFIAAGPSIRRAARSGEPGFWKVYEGGRVERRWP
jgi:hypothetical protein